MEIFYSQNIFVFFKLKHIIISAEMWLGILFAVLVAIIPTKVRTTAMSIFLFIINNVGGNLPVLVEPTRRVIGYRESLYIYYAGFYCLSEIIVFYIMSFVISSR